MHGLKPPIFLPTMKKLEAAGDVDGLLDVIIHYLVLRDGQRVNSTLGEFSSRQHVDGTVPWPMRWEAGGCLLAEHILERLVFRWDRTLHLRLRVFDEGGSNLDLRGFLERLGNRGQTVLETGLAPANDFTKIPSDFWRMLVEPGASHDDIYRGSLQYQKW